MDIDKLIFDLILTDDLKSKNGIADKIWQEALDRGFFPWSIQDFYMARAKGDISGFTVPAINLRSLTYDLSRAIFRVAKKNNAGAFIFEIARSEIGYTAQRPIEYTACVLAAAIKEGFQGPVFIQGDHFQVNAKKYQQDPQKELQGLKDIINEAIEAGFFNIDIDSSTLVDLSKEDKLEEQRLNFGVCAQMTGFIRGLEPEGITISIGGEIGEVGGKNSTPEELEAFMQGYTSVLAQGQIGISKISVQTGTSHGGVVLPDGSIAKVKLDFNTLKTLSKLARERFGLAGAVQHGASTLPETAFGKFPENEAAEVHLATQFQNMIYDSKEFPSDLREKIYSWIKDNLSKERKPDQTEEQFIYKTRKKALGPFKKEIHNLGQDKRDSISSQIEEKFAFLFKQLNVVDTKQMVDKFIKPKAMVRTKPGTSRKEQEHFEGDD